MKNKVILKNDSRRASAIVRMSVSIPSFDKAGHEAARTIMDILDEYEVELERLQAIADKKEN